MSENSYRDKKKISHEEVVEQDSTSIDIENVAGSVTVELAGVDDDNGKINELLEHADISKDDKDRFKDELVSLIHNTASLRDRLSQILEKAVDLGFYPLIKGIEMYSNLFGETKRKKDILQFVLKYVKEDIDIHDYEKYGYYSISEIDFPLKDNNAIFLELAGVKDIKYSYEISDVIEKANYYYFLHKKGISIDLLKKIKTNHKDGLQSLTDEGFIQKLTLLDKTCLKSCKNSMDISIIKKISLDQI